MKDQNLFSALVGEIFLGDDFRLLKSYPFIIKYKKDIVFTPEIVNHFIDNYLFDDENYLQYISIDAFDLDQYRFMLETALAKEKHGFAKRMPHLTKVCEENFDIALLIYKSTNTYRFGDDLTKHQIKKIVSMTIRKFNDSDFYIKCPTFPENVMEAFVDRVTNMLDNGSHILGIKPELTHKQARQIMEYMSRRSASLNECRNKVFVMFTRMLFCYDDLYIEVAENYHTAIMTDFIMKHLMTVTDKSFIVDKIIDHFNISYRRFKTIKKKTHFDSPGVRLLAYLLKETGEITYCRNNQTKSLYRDGWINYQISKIIAILKDVNKFQAYINSMESLK